MESVISTRSAAHAFPSIIKHEKTLGSAKYEFYSRVSAASLPPSDYPLAMSSSQPPAAATGAVLVKSAEMPEGSQKVEELDFNKFKGKPITVDDLYQGMRHMGFQASSMGEAIRIINDMVRRPDTSTVLQAVSSTPLRAHE